MKHRLYEVPSFKPETLARMEHGPFEIEGVS
jgi:hypothetical protein